MDIKDSGMLPEFFIALYPLLDKKQSVCIIGEAVFCRLQWLSW